MFFPNIDNNQHLLSPFISLLQSDGFDIQKTGRKKAVKAQTLPVTRWRMAD
jgi:hypothetical protein